MKLLLDMNLSPDWVAFLADNGIEAVHWSTQGPATAPDTAIMAFAKTNDSVVLTHDPDSSAMLGVTHGEKPSVVQIRAGDIGLEAVGRQVVAALKQMVLELEAGALNTIDPARTRLRLLPLRR
jgi:predicted nuclease of predicted toxin-antitoxin system